MAAYAALVSLMQTIDEIEHHPFPPIYLEKEQVESLTANVIFFQEFLEAYSYISNNEEGLLLESRIAAPAQMAEDIIESHIVDQIHDGNYGENIISIDLYRGLQKVIEDMNLIKKEVMEIKERMKVQPQPYKNSLITSAGSSTSSSTINTTTSMVGFDDILIEMLDKLTGGQSGRQIIPVVGMGGIGKTTLARNVYAHPLLKYHFDICAWVTISLNYDVRDLLNEILRQTKQDGDHLNEMNESELGEVLYKYLHGRRYLIVLDDMWDIEAWNKINSFPDNNNGSRIVVTSRQSNLVSQLTNSWGLEMKFLDIDKSWDLFSKIVFREDGCPPELQKIGMDIVRNCRGLPLSIVVIAGVLAKSGFEREYWEHVAENLNSFVNSGNDKQCLRILEMSYYQLPVHLKPCFLHLGVYQEDQKIQVSDLGKLWVSEGFLKPVGGKNLEEVATEYLKELVDRNLVLDHDLEGFVKCKKYIKIHDLLRDLCLKQAEKERFYNIIEHQNVCTLHDIHSQRRFVIYDSVIHASLSLPLARSFIWCYDIAIAPLQDHRLLRIFADRGYAMLHPHEYECSVNLRYIVTGIIPKDNLHWNLQILTVNLNSGPTPTLVGFWSMTQLRHLNVTPYTIYLPDPPTCNAEEGEIVLHKLQSLRGVRNLKVDKEMAKRIPNIKKLVTEVSHEGSSSFDLSYLDRLQKLESVRCGFLGSVNLNFPQWLKKLTLKCRGRIHYWESILEKIGSLPFLNKLYLHGGYFRSTWTTVEGQFLSLKVLKLQSCNDLEKWTSESSHFPRLEHLHLNQLDKLNEIPSGVGEIETLRSIELYRCGKSVIISAKEIQEEQEESYGGEDEALQVRVTVLCKDYDELQGLATPNFRIIKNRPQELLMEGIMQILWRSEWSSDAVP